MLEKKGSTKKRVGILRGGTGENYISSLEKGGEIISHIFENLSHKYRVFDILVDKKGVWHLNGVPVLPADLIHKVDVVWNISHPSLSIALNSLSITNVSLDSFSFALENSREMLREHLKQIGLPMSKHIILPVYQKDFDQSSPPLRQGYAGRARLRHGEADPIAQYAIKKAKEVFEKFSSPWIVRSFSLSNETGAHLAKTFPELVKAIEDGMEHQQSILVEEFIPGKVASVHSLPDFRGEDIYTFPPMNIFGGLSSAERRKLTDFARDLHKYLNVKHYLKSGFVINKRGKIYLLNINSTPDFKPNSYFSQTCEQVGVRIHQVIEHIIEKSL